uniref:Uncharacterized protein n=1 Tax=Oryza nivara TaxID=4536 RepID=A0A0E0G2F1_ORYNI
MATAAAGDDPPSPPPPAERPGGWLSGLVCGAGRLLAAVLGPDSPDSGTGGSASSSQESSSQSPPPPRGHRGSGDNTAHFASNNQFNQSGKEITLKDSGVGSLALVSEIDPKDAILQMLLQETYSRSECDILIKIIHERVVDSDPDVVEPSIVLPIAWQTSQQQDHALKRSNSCTGHNLDESHSRSVRPKLNDLNISNRQDGILKSHSASFEEATTKYPNAFRGIPEDTKKLFKDIPLLGTDNLIFSNIVSYDDTDNDISALRGKRPAVTARTFASATSEANRDNRCPTMLYPYSDRQAPSAMTLVLFQNLCFKRTRRLRPVHQQACRLKTVLGIAQELACKGALKLGENPIKEWSITSRRTDSGWPGARLGSNPGEETGWEAKEVKKVLEGQQKMKNAQDQNCKRLTPGGAG